MTATEFTLPDGFLVGASTAAHQVEGNNVSSDIWRMERSGHPRFEEPSGDAADSYHRWPEDMQILADLGFNAYRFSIEWARIEPERDFISKANVLHYRKMVERALELGLEPVVTLHHFTNPSWLTEMGGLTGAEAVDRFSRYVETILPVLDAGVTWVCTINEPNMAAIIAALMRGDGPPPGSPGWSLPLADDALAQSLTAIHLAARGILKQHNPNLRVGWSMANLNAESVPGGEERAATFRERNEDQFLRTSRDDDFLGVQAYTRAVFGPDGAVTPETDEEPTLTGWEYYPPAIGDALRHSAEVVGNVPLMVTENGIATGDDERRIAYTTGALQSVAAAMTDGIDVRGYLHWSALDNYEWGSFTPTFGLIGWDRETFERTPKPSARWLGDLARRKVIPSGA
jgi:beta-glucosidase